jgi:hypothetical protein
MIERAIVTIPQPPLELPMGPDMEQDTYPAMNARPPRSFIRESRRSTRVPLKVVVSVEGSTEPLTCEGETIVVNLHGALLSTKLELSVGMEISVQVFLTGKKARARVVYLDPADPLHCGIELHQPQNIWGIPLPPEDWAAEPGADRDRR